MRDAIIVSIFLILLAYVFGAFAEANFLIWEWKESTRNICAGMSATVLTITLMGLAMDKTTKK